MSAANEFLPMPTKFGIGVMSPNPLLEETVANYRLEIVGRFHNYHVTKENWRFPQITESVKEYVVDGFSPNLNKELHVGHLRNLALAKSLSAFLPHSKFVAILGCSLGVIKAALEGWSYWTNFVHYKPAVYHDLTLPQDIIETRIAKENEFPEETHAPGALPQVWDGPKGSVIVKRSDGRPLYSFYDLLFAKEVGPTHYITGHEQREHFDKLGLGEKHLPMGLILGSDGKKLKSRTGDALLAKDALQLVVDNLGEISSPTLGHEIAWNILSWNLLHAARGTDLKFEVEKWVRPESPGMYITYTYARVARALGNCAARMFPPELNDKLTEADVKLLGLSEQYLYYRHMAIRKMDPAPIANFAHELARAIGAVYETERIRGGREEFVDVIRHALWRLEHCMTDLGMFLVFDV